MLTLAAQNRVLTSQGLVYALATGDGDDDNNKFTLTGVELSAKPGTAADSYKVRIDASDADFGAANAAMVDVTVVTRAAAADAALSGLALSAGAVLSPAFASDIISYTASVANAVTSITVTPTLNNANASVMVNGAPVVSGAASGAIGLAVGGTEIKVVVTAEDTETTRTYTVAVTHAIDTTTAFITTWRATANDAITFPGRGSYTIDWGDGTIDNATGAVNHTYAAAGDYDIAASSAITRFNLNKGADREKLIDIKQWGGAQWSSMETTFYGAINMRMSATDAPDLSAVVSMRGMFRAAGAFNGAIGTWDVGNVTNMEFMFSGADAFNQDLNDWDVGKVTGMSNMFLGADAFNQDLNDWDVGNVKRMSSMFRVAYAFNGAIGTWSVDNVTTMEGMFYAAAAFNQDIGGWDVGDVTNMENMFFGAAAFNGDIGGWDVGDVTDMESMFDGAAAFNQDIGGWAVGKVTDMAGMFNGAAAFSQNLGRWYIVGTPNLGYNGATDIVVLTLAAQNSVLTDQGPVYALAAGDGDDDNNKFTLTGATGAELSANIGVADGSYKVRIGAGGVDFGAANAVMVAIAVAVGDNDASTADAGPDQAVNEGELVTLDGSGSSDPEGEALTYAWTQTGGPAVALSSATVVNPTFTAPSQLANNATLTFSLTVTDASGLSSTAAATVAIAVAAGDNDAPTADAGPGQAVNEGELVTLDGSGSSDPEGEALTYAWTQTGGPAVALSSATVHGRQPDLHRAEPVGE